MKKIIFCLIFLSGCATMTNRYYPAIILDSEPEGFDINKNLPPSKEYFYDANYDDIFEIMIKELTYEGYKFKISNKQDGLLSTYWIKRGDGYSKFDIKTNKISDKLKVIMTCYMYNPKDIFKMTGLFYNTVYSAINKKIERELNKLINKK